MHKFDDIPADVTQDGLSIWNEGNHGGHGDPHQQYRLPTFRTNSGNAGQWLPIIDRNFSLDQANTMLWLGFHATFLFHDGRGYGGAQPSGVAAIHFYVKGDKTFHCGVTVNATSAKAHTETEMREGATGADLIRAYVTTVDAVAGTYRLRVYMQCTAADCLYFIKPLWVDSYSGLYTRQSFVSPHMQTAFRSHQENVDYLFLKKQGPATLPTVDANTVRVFNGLTQGSFLLNVLPGASEIWRGKLVTVPTAIADATYIVVLEGSTHRWRLAKPIQVASAPSSGTWAVGDRAENTAPSVAGTAGSQYIVNGWVCTVAGTPGTWVACRTLTGT